MGRTHGGPRGTIHDNQTGAALESSLDKTPELPAVTFEADALFIPGSDRRALLCPGRLCGVEFPVALFDAASPFVPSDDDADMVRASSLAGGGDFLLRLAGCQGKDLIPQGWRAALAPAGFPTVARRRPRGRAGAAALVAVAGVFAAAIFSARGPLV